MPDPIIFCDVEVPQPIGAGLARWNASKISWRDMGIAYPNASFSVAMDFTIDLIESNCGLKIEKRTDKAANLQSYFKQIDGPNGVLARHWLPGYPSQPTEMLQGEWDKAEIIWVRQHHLNRVTAHEVMHGLGIHHYNGAPSLMNARLDMDVELLDPWTRDELQLRHGPPGEEPIPKPPQIDWMALVKLLLELFSRFGNLTAEEEAELRQKVQELTG